MLHLGEGDLQLVQKILEDQICVGTSVNVDSIGSTTNVCRNEEWVEMRILNHGAIWAVDYVLLIIVEMEDFPGAPLSGYCPSVLISMWIVP